MLGMLTLPPPLERIDITSPRGNNSLSLSDVVVGRGAAMQMPLSTNIEADAFYGECLDLLVASGSPFLLGGSFALSVYTGLRKRTKDLDVFCKPGDYPRILSYFQARDFAIEVEDERWIAKIKRGDYFVDVIFNSTSAIAPVTDQWLAAARAVQLGERTIPIMSPTELIWSKVFLQDRIRYDGADIAHLLLKRCEEIEWRRLLSYLDQYWEVLLIHLINFSFVYPTERKRIPHWLMDELTGRLAMNAKLPVPTTKICRGRLFSRSDYVVDIKEWGYADVVGEGERTDGRDR
jgi:hypothetical protein